MNLKTRILLSGFIATFLTIQCQAQIQLQSFISFDYSMGVPIGSVHEFISKKRFDGFHFQWRHFIHRDVSLGFRAGYNNFKTVLDRDVYQTDRGTVSAVQTRYFSSSPIIPMAYYYMRSKHYVMPYLGGGLGPYFLNHQKFYGVVKDFETNIKFGFSPEVGVVIPFKNSGVGLIVSGRYNQVFYSRQEISGVKYFEASISLFCGYGVFDDSFMK